MKFFQTVIIFLFLFLPIMNSFSQEKTREEVYLESALKQLVKSSIVAFEAGQILQQYYLAYQGGQIDSETLLMGMFMSRNILGYYEALLDEYLFGVLSSFGHPIQKWFDDMSDEVHKEIEEQLGFKYRE